jgi:hypothetical protein
MHCTNCNATLQDIARFCSICGTPVVTSGVAHVTADTSTPSEADDGDTPLSPVEPAEQSSTPPVESTPEEQQSPTPPASTETAATNNSPTEDDLTEAEPTQIITVPEQQQHHLLATTAMPTPDTTEVSEEPIRIIVASPIPPRPQPSQRSLHTATIYDIPEAQTSARPANPANPANPQQHETIPPALQIPLRHTDEHVTTDAQIAPEIPPHLSFLSPNTPSPSLPYFRLDTSNKVRYMLPAVVNPQTGMVRRRKRGGLGCLLTLLILIVIIAGGWIFVLRPFLHNLAENQLNQALSAAVNQIPPGGAAVLPTSSLKISETVINNLIVLNTSPASPIQSPATHITPANIEIDFQLYGQPCSITSVPVVQNNQLVATSTTESGIIGLVLSPSDITTIVNQHLAAAQNRLGRSVKSVQLKEHEIDLTLG